jgi:hypothetical protein
VNSGEEDLRNEKRPDPTCPFSFVRSSVLAKRDELADFGGRLLFILRMEMTLGYLDGYRVLRQRNKK